MNILFVYFDKTIQNDNLYVKSLCEEIRRQNGSIECSIDAFWNSTRKYDIVHIQFPEVIFKWRQPSDNGLKGSTTTNRSTEKHGNQNRIYPP